MISLFDLSQFSTFDIFRDGSAIYFNYYISLGTIFTLSMRGMTLSDTEYALSEHGMQMASTVLTMQNLFFLGKPITKLTQLLRI